MTLSLLHFKTCKPEDPVRLPTNRNKFAKWVQEATTHGEELMTV